jgi:hypothetical protein
MRQASRPILWSDEGSPVRAESKAEVPENDFEKKNSRKQRNSGRPVSYMHSAGLAVCAPSPPLRRRRRRSTHPLMARRPPRSLIPLLRGGIYRRSLVSTPGPPDAVASTSFQWSPHAPTPPDPSARWRKSWSPTSPPLPQITAFHLRSAVYSVATALLELQGPDPDPEPTLRAHSFPTLLAARIARTPLALPAQAAAWARRVLLPPRAHPIPHAR